ncbi:MAG: hypothetical protein HYV38_01095 [Candidatus Levybacteria bacterium]|nr:hypothetical protein [Candidatus Levybacteria bacterium]
MRLNENIVWELLRLSLSFIFLWAFFDKLFGLGFATSANKSWLLGISPTTGFLSNAPHGPLASIFNNLSGNILVDFLFMGGLFLIGTALLLGIGMRITSYSGALLMFLIYLSLFPSENNPLIDQHVIYILVLIGLAIRSEKQKFSFGKKWSQLSFIKKYPILE